MSSSSEKNYSLLPQEDTAPPFGKTVIDIKHELSCETIYYSFEELYDVESPMPSLKPANKPQTLATSDSTGKSKRPHQLLCASLWIAMVLHLLTQFSKRSLAWISVEDTIKHIYVLYNHVCIQAMLAGVISPPIDQSWKDGTADMKLTDIIRAATTSIIELQERVDAMSYEGLNLNDLNMNTHQQEDMIETWLHHLPSDFHELHFRTIIRQELRRLKQLFIPEFTLWDVVLLFVGTTVYFLDIFTDLFAAAVHFYYFRFAVAGVTLGLIWISGYVVAASSTQLSNSQIAFFAFIPLLPVFDNWTNLQLGLLQRLETSQMRKRQLATLRSRLANVTLLRTLDMVNFKSVPQFLLQLAVLLRLQSNSPFEGLSWYLIMPGVIISVLMIGWSYTLSTHMRLLIDDPAARLPCLLFNIGYYGSFFTALLLFYSEAPVWSIVLYLSVRFALSLALRVATIKSPDQSLSYFLYTACFNLKNTLLLILNCGMFYLFEPMAPPTSGHGIKFCMRLLDITILLMCYCLHADSVNWPTMLFVYGLIILYITIGRLNRKFQLFY